MPNALDLPQREPQAPRWHGLLLWGAVAAGVALLALASRGLFTGYSYWLDEIFSVVASSDSWPQLFGHWIFQMDVHPPLYQVVLKLWMSVFGTSEVATRLLSFSFAAGTVLLLLREVARERQLRRVLALILLGVSPAFVYFSQETRSYSMLLFFSALLTLNYLRSVSGEIKETAWSLGRYVLISLALSLVHCFGFILAFVVATMRLFDRFRFKSKCASVVVILLICVWPAVHILFGKIASRSGGNFWITVKPFVGTLKVFVEGVFPAVSFGRDPYAILSVVVVAAVVAGLAITLLRRQRRSVRGAADQALIAESLRCAVLLALVVLIASVVDLRTPISTSRNFIVALPAVVLLVSNCIVYLGRNGGFSRLLAGVLFLLCIASFGQKAEAELSRKQAPFQNWKQLAAYLEKTKVCKDGCYELGGSSLIGFYLPESAGSGHLERLSSDPVSSLVSANKPDDLELVADRLNAHPSTPLLGFHFAGKSLPSLLRLTPDRVCFAPKQAHNLGTFVLLSKNSVSGREQELGLRPCPLPRG